MVIALFAILTGLASPVYRSHVARACRAEAAAELEQLAARQEQFYGYHFRYASTVAALGWSPRSAGGRHQLRVEREGGAADGYALEAEPVEASGCAGADGWILRLGHSGQRQSRQGTGPWRAGWH